jgi:hypothetical protein
MALGNSPPENSASNSASDLTAGLSNIQGATGGAYGDQSLCGATLANGIVITERSMPSDISWPADLILDRQKNNWQKWSRRLNIEVDKHLFRAWLNGSIPCPDSTTHATAYQIWKNNDHALRTFILEHVSAMERVIVCELPDSQTIYKALRHRHQRIELHAQVLLIREALDIRFRPGVRLTDTFTEIEKLHTRFKELGSMDEEKTKDHLLTVFIMINLVENYPDLYSKIDRALDKPFSSSRDVIPFLHAEERLQLFRTSQSLPPTASGIPCTHTPMAASAKDKKKIRPFCANCKRRSHSTDFCVLPGGKMAGRTIEEARAAQLVAAGILRRGSHG